MALIDALRRERQWDDRLRAELAPLPARVRARLLRSSLRSAEAIRRATDAQLLQLFGIGPHALAAIRAHFPHEAADRPTGDWTMTAQHTPGPWEIGQGKTWYNGKVTSVELFVRRPEGDSADDVAIAGDITNPYSSLTDDVAWANARLIAAAPDLLAALTELVDVKRIDDTEGKTEDYQRRKPLAWEAARAAIAKAESAT